MVRGRISQERTVARRRTRQGANRPRSGGESAGGHKSQRMNQPGTGGEEARGRNSQGPKEPVGKQTRGRMSQGRKSQGANKPGAKRHRAEKAIILFVFVYPVTDFDHFSSK